MEGLYVAIGAVIGATVSSLISGFYARSTKKLELRAQTQARDLELEAQRIRIALQCAELKHQQLVAVQDWAIRSDGKARNMDLWDPLQSVIVYLDGMNEYRTTGKWTKAQKNHYGKE